MRIKDYITLNSYDVVKTAAANTIANNIIQSDCNLDTAMMIIEKNMPYEKADGMTVDACAHQMFNVVMDYFSDVFSKNMSDEDYQEMIQEWREQFDEDYGIIFKALSIRAEINNTPTF